MRYGIISDIHGNLEALEVVLDFLAGERIDRYAFLGDAVGYGPNPNEVCERLRELCHIAVLGNHDAAVTGRMDYSEYYEAARHALDWCAKRLSAKNSKWLKSLPFKVREGEIEFCHGAPVAPEMFDYVFAPEQVVDLLEATEDMPCLTCIGHSHLTISFAVAQNTITPMIVPEIKCEPQNQYIITCGSVGQPRDRDPRACCATFDTESRWFKFHRLEYDVLTVRQKIIDAGLAPVFGERLLVGM
jgi:diadenosine tetraphosphatase ApaH/serine/threonine PP2A family protein phosphatase